MDNTTSSGPISSIKQATAICGTLSKTSKMPGYSMSLPASACKTGQKLMKIEGSVCEDCYACKGRYRFKNVQDAMQKRLLGIEHPQWCSALTYLILHSVTIGVPYFRFFDSGDLQTESHLMKIFAVCNNLPAVQFWLPTREHAIVKNVLRRFKQPSNLVIRASSAMIDGIAPKYATHTAGVVSDASYSCPAPKQGGECGDCRKCWEPSTTHVAYKLH